MADRREEKEVEIIGRGTIESFALGDLIANCAQEALNPLGSDIGNITIRTTTRKTCRVTEAPAAYQGRLWEKATC
jgi:hypothetical protein